VTASVITIGANILSRLFGYVREAAIANYFGTREILDTFLLAFTVPELLAAVIFSVLPLALIPSVKQMSVYSGSEDRDLFWSGLSVFIIALAAISIMIYFARGQIFSWLVPGSSYDRLNEGKKLIAILSGLVFFRGIDAYFRSWLFEKKHFIIPAASAIILNAVILASIIIFYKKLGIRSLAYGWLASSAALCIYTGFFAFLLVRPAVRKSLSRRWIKILIGSTLIIAIVQSLPLFYPIIDRYLAAKYLGPGQIAALRYAFVLIQIPTGVFVVAFNITSFPWISDYSDSDHLVELRNLYSKSIRLLVYVMGLTAAGIAVFSQDIVRVALQRGAFNEESMILTSKPLLFYAVGTIFYSIYIFQMRIYFGRQSYMRLGTILFILFMLKLVLSLILVGPMEQNGLALATAISWLAGFVIMSLDLGRILDISLKNILGPSILKTMSMVAVVTLYWIVIGQIWTSDIADGTLSLFSRLTIFALSGIFLYFGIARVLCHPDQRTFIDSMGARIRSLNRVS
jgi:putative peptidoglycan lipid II flippase